MKTLTAEQEMAYDAFVASCSTWATGRHLYVPLDPSERRVARDENLDEGGYVLGVLGVVSEKTNVLTYYGYGIALTKDGKLMKNRLAKSIRMHPSRVPERVREKVRHAVAP